MADTQRSAAPSNPAVATSHSGPPRPSEAGRSGLVPRYSGGDRPYSAVTLRPNTAPHYERSVVQGVGRHRRCVHDLPDAALPGFALLLPTAVLCLRERSWSPPDNNTLLFSWFMAGVLVFGTNSPKYPQYFVLTLIPLYCYLWTELRWASWSRLINIGVAVTILLARLGPFWLRVLSRNYNALLKSSTYAAIRILPGDLAVTEEPLSDLILHRTGALSRSPPRAYLPSSMQ